MTFCGLLFLIEISRISDVLSLLPARDVESFVALSMIFRCDVCFVDGYCCEP